MPFFQAATISVKKAGRFYLLNGAFDLQLTLWSPVGIIDKLRIPKWYIMLSFNLGHHKVRWSHDAVLAWASNMAAVVTLVDLGGRLCRSGVRQSPGSNIDFCHVWSISKNYCREILASDKAPPHSYQITKEK